MIMINNDKFYPSSLKKLLQIVLKQLKKGEVLGVPNEVFFKPKENDFFKLKYINDFIDSPIGVAAGPHTQLSQNIIIAWLSGARFIELKTIQTLDEIEVAKPCIDMQDEGYNCEWSQELRIEQSFNQYLNAWIIIHILKDVLGYNEIGAAFNMSIGYDLKGIMSSNVQWFLDKMTNAEKQLNKKISEIKNIYPTIDSLKIPSKISDSVTLSTMHGCPWQEIEQIAEYLISERKLNTIIKLNPTLLGKENLNQIIIKSGFKTSVPEIAFEHDLNYSDAKPMIERLLKKASESNTFFGIKLTNTLESLNNKNIFNKDNQMMYMSGKALHPISVNLVKKVQTDFKGKLPISFSGGADAFNIAELLACGLKPVTVSSDLLKPGGYLRFSQYYELLRKNNDNFKTINDLINSKAGKNNDLHLNIVKNLDKYSKKVLKDKSYKKNSFKNPSIKTNRKLSLFDCIDAPCKTTCPTNQNIPQYMFQVKKNDLAGAMQTILQDNPFPTVTGYVCDHNCQLKCTRINYDNALNIREIKRYVADNYTKKNVKISENNKNKEKIAVIGAGPAGLSAAFYLCKYGFDVEIFEKRDNAGGMTANAIPSFRLPDEKIEIDINSIVDLGIKINYNYEVNISNFAKIKNKYNYIFVAPGAQSSLKINLPGINSKGVLDPLEFFFKTRKNHNLDIGKNVAIIGGGNTAMDAARISKRLIPAEGRVVVLYRRKKEFMPANYNEIIETLNEGIEIVELVEPEKIISKNGKLTGVELVKTKLVNQYSGKRPKPVKINGSEFVMNFDTVIFAVGQVNEFYFLKEKEYKKHEIPFTEYDNVFIGGDAVRGAASAIKAIADGKNAAYKILKKYNSEFIVKQEYVEKNLSRKELKIKRSKRVFGEEPAKTSLNQRNNFKLITQTYSKEQAQKEAERCLFCDEVCDICTSVCPNLANQTYEIEPFEAEIPKIKIIGQRRSIEKDRVFQIKQKYQTFNIADWCNECGNCATFCPTNGKPYSDKPKIHLSKESFLQSPFGYFISKNDNHKIVEFKDGYNKFKLTINSDFMVYESKKIKAEFNMNFKLLNFDIKIVEDVINFKNLPQMFVISNIDFAY